MIVTAGLDAGAATTKAVIMEFIEGKSEVIGRYIVPTGFDCNQAADNALKGALKEAKITFADISYIIGTGYGRRTIDVANSVISEITCHAVGAKWLHDPVRTVIDIGGQDSKAISLDENGGVVNFAMNEKCAAGTGRFLEVMAKALGVSISEMGSLSLKSKSPSTINSMCTVFAESEVISLIARGRSREDIVSGLHISIAKRIVAMARRVGVREDIVFTGGVAKNEGMVAALQEELGMEIYRGRWDPQYVGALGASRIALDELAKIAKVEV